METLGQMILFIIERLSSFRGKSVLVGVSESVLYTDVAFIQSVLYK